MKGMLLVILAALALTASAQGPGDGVSKTTYSSSQPWVGMAFVQKYFPTTAAEDSGHGNVDTEHGGSTKNPTVQGRSQLTLAKQFTERNCELFSTDSGSIKVGKSLGSDCSYSKTSSFSFAKDSASMYKVYAHTKDQCCKACVAAKGCVSATCTGKCTAGGPDTSSRRLLQGPQSYEGFGLHLVDVTGSKTTGALNISQLEDHWTARLGDMSTFDAFMDYNVVLFAGDDLPNYAKAMSADGVKFLSASWKDASADTWYSLIVHVPHSQMIIELVSKTSPGAEYEQATASLEARISPRQVSRLSEGKVDGVLSAVAVTRAVSNISRIESFYTTAIGIKAVHTVDADGVSRRCYGWTGAKSDVCFVQRTSSAAYDSTFSVFDNEKNIWAAHKALITDVNVQNDKYNDNHYAVDLMGMSGTSIASWFTKHKAEAFPIDFPKTYFAWDCMQEYIIDPTGFAIQSDFDITLPGCTDAVGRAPRFTATSSVGLPVHMIDLQ